MLYVGRTHTAHKARVRHARDARLEAGWVRRMCVPKARYWTSMTPVIRVTSSKTAPLSS